MVKSLKTFLILLVIFISLPDQLFGSCTDDCYSSATEIAQIVSVVSNLKNLNEPIEQENHATDCTCPVHAHHCSHISFVNTQKFIRINESKANTSTQFFYSTGMVPAPFLDSLFRPPKV